MPMLSALQSTLLDPGSRHGIAITPQIPSGFGQNRGILFFAEDT